MRPFYEAEYPLDEVLDWIVHDESLATALIDMTSRFYFQIIWDGKNDLVNHWYGEVAVPIPDDGDIYLRVRLYDYREAEKRE